MAEGPGWSYGLSEPGRFVLAHGLQSTLEPPPHPLDDDAWTRLVDETDRHRLGGLLIDAVVTGALPTTPEQRDAACRAEIEATNRRLVYEPLAGAVLEHLEDHGIETRLLKGMAMARLDYPDEQWRPTGDVDLLVRPEQIADAVAALVATGGDWTDPEPTAGWIRLVGKGATVFVPSLDLEVDLHRILVWGPLGVRVPDTELWDTSRSFVLGGRERLTLGREETLLHACAHLLVLGVTRAREVRDVAQILTNPDLDTGRLVALAERWGQSALLATATRFADDQCALSRDAHSMGAWARSYRVSWRDALWLRTGAPEPRRIHGLEQLGVFIELGRSPQPWVARRVLLRANFRPAPGTYQSPWRRVGRLARRVPERFGLVAPTSGPTPGPTPGIEVGRGR